MSRLSSLAFLMLVIIGLIACKETTKETDQEYIIAFYNLENLFDTINDPETIDEEFLPSAKLKWDTRKYEQKLKNMSKVLASLDTMNLPHIIGLCEVENFLVLDDLINTSYLEAGNYNIIHKDSPDARGIDNAMLYRSNSYTPVENQWIPIRFPFDTVRKTRDILYSKGLLSEDTLHIFVNHWPSRWGGQEKTIPNRNYVASVIRGITDSLFALDHTVNIIVMGDLNDNPDDESVKVILKAQLPEDTICNTTLYNLSNKAYSRDEGTIYWKSWDLFDQFIVSGSLLKKMDDTSGLYPEMIIHKPRWILFEDDQGVLRPNRTKGRYYYGGYSDHLPVYIQLSI